jgi:hypothetical protein
VLDLSKIESTGQIPRHEDRDDIVVDAPKPLLKWNATTYFQITHSNESPQLLVSVSGKRDFAGQRQRPEKARHIQLLVSRDRAPTHKPRQLPYLHDAGKSLFARTSNQTIISR